MSQWPKVSFRLEPDALRDIETFAHTQALTTSEALRVLVKCGMVAVEKAGLKQALPLGHGATRGRFPAPERSSEDATAFEQERKTSLWPDTAKGSADR